MKYVEFKWLNLNAPFEKGICSSLELRIERE